MNDKKQQGKFSVKTLSEQIGRVVGGYSCETFTGKIVITVDMREGGIGRVGIDTSAALRLDDDLK